MNAGRKNSTQPTRHQVLEFRRRYVLHMCLPETCLPEDRTTARNSTAPGADEAVDVSHRQSGVVDELIVLLFALTLTEFDSAQLESRHDALVSPSTLCIRVPSPLAWGRNSVRELRAQRWHVLGDGDCGSIVTASPFFFVQYDRGRYLL